MRQRPRGGHRRADATLRRPRSAAVRRAGARPAPRRYPSTSRSGLRARRLTTTAPASCSGPAKAPVDVVVVGAGPGQQNRRDAAQLIAIPRSCPCGVNHRQRRRVRRVASGTKRSTVAVGSCDRDDQERPWPRPKVLCAASDPPADGETPSSATPRNSPTRPPTPARSARSTVSAARKSPWSARCAASRPTPRAAPAASRAEFFDGTDTVTLVWLGQRRIPGIECGRTLRVHGRLGMLDNGSKAIYNPHYEIQR